MVAYIRSDLDFILAQIIVAEKHAAYVANPLDPNAAPLYGVGLAGQVGSVPTYTLSIGLRTVDGQIQQPAARPGTVGHPRTSNFPNCSIPVLPAGGTPFDPGTDPAPTRRPTIPGSLVFDSSLRTISNLIVDQTLGNPAAILKGLETGGVVDASLANVALVQVIYDAFKPALTPSISPAW